MNSSIFQSLRIFTLTRATKVPNKEYVSIILAANRAAQTSSAQDTLPVLLIPSFYPIALCFACLPLEIQSLPTNRLHTKIMKSATLLLLICTCAPSDATSPPEERALVTTYEMVTVTTTVFVGRNRSDELDPTEPSGHASWSRGRWCDTLGTSAPSYTPGLSGTSTLSAPTLSSSLSVALTQSSISPSYIQDILNSHNIHRTNASVPGLTWNDSLASIAVDIAISCIYAHDTSAGGGGYGQNIGAGALPEDIAAMITDQMYNGEINFYPGYGSEPDMSNFERWGHYSQIVWKSTTSVGCATLLCSDGLTNTGASVRPYFTVCNYSPPGKLHTKQLSFYT